MQDEREQSNLVVTTEPHPTLRYLGGVIGGFGGLLFLAFMVNFVGSFLGKSPNLLVTMTMYLLSILNLVGFIGYPALGAHLGYNYIFTTRTIRSK